MNHVPRYQAGHTGVAGECKWEQVDTRRSSVRIGSHPREPRVKKHHDSTAGLPGTHPESGELGKDGEEDDIIDQALDDLTKDSKLPPATPLEVGGASSSSSGAAPPGASSGE